MTWRRWLALSLWLATFGCVCVILWLTTTTGISPDGVFITFLQWGPDSDLACPQNRVAWAYLSAGLLGGAHTAAFGYAGTGDAREIVEDLSNRLAHEVDLDTVHDEFLDVMDETIKPETAAVWIRDLQD